MELRVRRSLALAGVLSVLFVGSTMPNSIMHNGSLIGAAAAFDILADTDATVDYNDNDKLKVFYTDSSGNEQTGNVKDLGTNNGTLSVYGYDEEAPTSFNFTNNGTFDGGATIKLNGGSNTSTGVIEQDVITVTNNGYTNNGNITVTTLINNGTITGNNGSIIVDELTNNKNKTIEKQNLTIGSDSTNAGTIQNSTVYVDGELTNEGTISNSTINVNSDLINNKTISGGTVNVNDGGTLTHNGTMTGNLGLTIKEGGTIVVSDGNGVDVSGQINIQAGGTVEVGNGGSLTLKAGDVWNGDVTYADENGSVSLIGATIENCTYTQDGVNQELILNGSTLTIGGDESSVSISDGTVSIGNGSTLNIIDGAEVSGGTLLNEGTGNTVNIIGTELAEDVNLNITDGMTYNVINSVDEDGDFDTAGSLTIDEGDTWSGTGTVHIDGGDVTYSGNKSETNGIITADSGSLNLEKDLNVGTGSYIKEAIELEFKDANIAITGGEVQLDSGDTWGGEVSIDSGKLSVNQVSGTHALKANGGEVSITNESAITLSEGSSIAAAAKTTIDNSTLNIEDGTSVTLDKATGDSWSSDSTVNLVGGTLDYSLDSNGILKAEDGTLKVSGGTLTLNGDSLVEDAVNVAVNGGNVVISGGSLVLDGADTWADNSKISMTQGSLTYSLTQNGKVDITGGEFGIEENGIFTMKDADDVIGKDAEITIDGTLNVTNGKATIDGSDTWSGTVTVSDNGKLTLDNVTDNGALQATGGELSIINGSEIDITGSNVIAEAVKTTIDNSTVNISDGGSVTLDKATGDSWSGDSTITLDKDGTLNYNLESNGKIVAEDGNLNINGGKLTLAAESSVASEVHTVVNGDIDITGGSIALDKATGDTWSDDSTINLSSGSLDYDLDSNGKIVATGGNLNINEGGVLTLTDANDKIDSAVKVAIKDTAKLDVQNGNVTIDGSDDWSGELAVSGSGNLAIDGVTSNGALQATGGTLGVTGSTLNIGSDSKITADAKTTLTDSIINITGGSVALNSGDTWSDDSTVSMTQGKLTYSLTQNGKVNITGGEFEIEKDGILTMKDADDLIAKGADVTIDGTLNVTNGSATIDGSDDWTGELAVSGSGNLAIDGVTSNGALQATGGTLGVTGSTLNIGSDSKITADAKTTLTDSIINITGGSVALDKATGDSWSDDSTINLSSGTLDYDLDSNGKIVATGGDLNINEGGVLTLADANDKIDSAVKVAIKDTAKLDVQNGNVTIDGSDTWTGELAVSGSGNLAIDGVTSNGALQATGGTLGVTGSTLNIGSDSKIAADATTTLTDSIINITGGSVALDKATGDTWSDDSTINLSSGTLDYDLDSNGKIVATGGNLNVNGGKLTLAKDSSVAGEVQTVINGDVDITKGSLVLDGSDSWASDKTITLKDGSLDYDLKSNGYLAAEGGKLNTHKDSVLEITTENSYIKSEVAAILEGDLKISNGGVVTVGDDGKSSSYIQDVMTGNVTIDDKGVLNIYNSVKLATGEEAKNQYIAINDSGLMNLEISTGEALHFETGLKGDGDIHKNGDGDVWFHGDYENYTGTILINSSGDLYFEHDLMGGLELGDVDGKTIGINADNITGNLTQEREATVKYSTYHDDVDLNLNGDIKVTKGQLIAESKGDTNINFGGNITVAPAEDAQNPVSMTITSNGSVTADKDVSISDAVMNLTANNNAEFKGNTTLNNSIINVNSGDLTFNQLTFAGTDSTLKDMNGVINNNSIKNLDIKDGTADFTIDVNGRKWKSDKFIISDISKLENGQINVSDWQLLGKAPIDRNIKLNVFDVSSVDPELAASISYTQTDKEIFTPIGWYQLQNATSRNPQTGLSEVIPGTLNAHLTRYNPQVFRGQVATLAMFNNQLMIDDMITNHVPLQSERYLAQGENANKYASINPLFAPYQYRKEEGGLWVKNYVTFERLSMTHNLNVGNNAYGTLIGADLPIVNMKNGWKFLPTAYIAYNGGHQHFDGVSMYQNGGQGGFMGTFMKRDFIGSVVAYAGGYFNEMKVAGYSDETGNWFAGTAAKASYNVHATKHFSLQPNLFVSYNAFGKQNWSSDFGEMSMASGMINGVNVAPGLNLIYARETWSLYGTFQYMYNINEGISGNAGNVSLPDVKMRHGYIQYGLGVTKTWKDRLNSFFQITFRNGGRTGVGFQLGFQYLFDLFNGGKKKASNTASTSKTVLKKLK